jgi:RNA polymerase sigma-70 factor (ECF subfamily)
MLQNKSPYTELSDCELFSLVKQDDIRAFEALYKRYWSLLVNAAYKRLDSQEKAEDIIQNIFIDLYQRRASIELTLSLTAYLHQALKFRVLNEYRSESIRIKYQKSLFLNLVCKNDFSDHLEAKELGLRINKVVNDLPEKCRQVFLLSRKENLSNKDISSSLNISVSTVEKHISKALKVLRCHL